jgi:hypothetical protein
MEGVNLLGGKKNKGSAHGHLRRHLQGDPPRRVSADPLDSGLRGKASATGGGGQGRDGRHKTLLCSSF